MSETTPRLSLPLLAPAQAQKHVTHNEALMLLDMFAQISFASFDKADPPVAPLAGEVHLVGANANDIWAGQDGMIARFDGTGWSYTAPPLGMMGYRADQNRLVMFNGSDWLSSPIDRLQSAVRIGLGVNASAMNPFAAELNSALWTAQREVDGGNGSILQTMNREGDTHDAGLVLQEAFITRALVGLFGSDDLRLSVSEDGAQFRDGVIINGASGIVSQPNLPRFHGVTNFDNYVPLNSWITVAINTLGYNDQGCFDAATNQFTAPVDGTYMFGGGVIYKIGTSPGKSRIQLLVNGSTVMAGSYGENSATHVTGHTKTQVTCLAPLNAGDTVELQYFMRLSDGYAAANDTSFWGAKVG